MARRVVHALVPGSLHSIAHSITHATLLRIVSASRLNRGLWEAHRRGVCLSFCVSVNIGHTCRAFCSPSGSEPGSCVCRRLPGGRLAAWRPTSSSLVRCLGWWRHHSDLRLVSVIGQLTDWLVALCAVLWFQVGLEWAHEGTRAQFHLTCDAHTISLLLPMRSLVSGPRAVMPRTPSVRSARCDSPSPFTVSLNRLWCLRVCVVFVAKCLLVHILRVGMHTLLYRWRVNALRIATRQSRFKHEQLPSPRYRPHAHAVSPREYVLTHPPTRAHTTE
jgi:hypothetical protein